MPDISYTRSVEKWGIFEISLPGVSGGNPFTERTIRLHVKGDHEEKTVNGFYDGDGVYRARFMPEYTGEYAFETLGDFGENVSGRFTVTEALSHGPVRVANTYHFAHADGTPCYPLGTTCYVWDMQTDELIDETLESLRESRFNKIRFCVFPKHYDYNLREPRSYPYVGTPMDSSVLTSENFYSYTGRADGNDFDLTRFNPEHFRHIERLIARLGKLGVQADLILLHPYDRWGFSCMTKEQDDLYLRYVTARFSAYQNVWWSLANEYDLMRSKTIADWERFALIIQQNDPYGHMRSVHNCRPFYDHTRPWVTHCSIQRTDIYRTAENVNELRERFKKPVVLDEIAYEGNIQYGWGNLTGEELTRRFWEGALRGGYPGHGETYLADDGILWWSHGGKLKGESWKRVGFLLDILNETPGIGLAPGPASWDEVLAVPEDMIAAFETGYRLYYYSFMRPSFRDFRFDDGRRRRVEVIDTWNMTIEDRGVFTGSFRVELPARQYMAVRVRYAD